MLMRMTFRPAACASLVKASGSGCSALSASSCCCRSSSPSLKRNLCPAALHAPSASSSGPTLTNLTSASSYTCANSGGTGSCKSSQVVTRVMVLRVMLIILPTGLNTDSMVNEKPYLAFSLSMHSPHGGYALRISSRSPGVSPWAPNMAWQAETMLPGPAVVRSAILGMPQALPARAPSWFIKGQYTTASAPTLRNQRIRPGSVSSKMTSCNLQPATIMESSCMPCSFLRSSRAPNMPGSRPE
mmetsp:Transcript_80672/g.214161  ORF Transcript_80672/g.214161 Transcript_80672/m.214161 type:complete len:243 (+) Transcript_80672:473-1201(+)